MHSYDILIYLEELFNNHLSTSIVRINCIIKYLLHLSIQGRRTNLIYDKLKVNDLSLISSILLSSNFININI